MAAIYAHADRCLGPGTILIPTDMQKRSIILSFMLISLAFFSKADNGYNLWLNYKPLRDTKIKASYEAHLGLLYFPAGSAKLQVARNELRLGIAGMLSITLKDVDVNQSQLGRC
jgi:hypothetical protein